MAKRVEADRLTTGAAPDGVKSVNLALQGGGAHGAFAWGALDRLLEEEGLAIEGISATSAGAMNAVVLAYGLTVGGRQGARQALDAFWRGIAQAALFSPLQPSPWDRFFGNYGLEMSAVFPLFDALTRIVSPYQSNPLNYNPLRQVLESSIDFAELRRRSAVKLFLSATNVRTGKVRVFRSEEISADAVLASACLPFLFQSVEIDGEHYWDGGYMGNPAVFPLIYECDCADVVVVHINPIHRPDVPTTAPEIMNRINEISFNSSLMREMRAVNFVSRLIDDGKVSPGSLRRMLIHGIAADDLMSTLGVASKLNADWDFLLRLRDTGRERTEQWLAAHFDRVGAESTVDLQNVFM
jgi:NTE family protein